MAERSAFIRENEPVLVMKVKRFQLRRMPDSIFLKHDIDLCIFFFIHYQSSVDKRLRKV